METKKSTIPNGRSQSDSTNRKRGVWVVLGLSLLTLVAHLVTRQSNACGPLPDDPVMTQASHVVEGRQGLVSFRGQVDRGAVQAGGDGRVRLELVIQADEVESNDSSLPTDLYVVLDRSGSMGGEKIVHARAAARELVEQLGARDRFALITYSSGADTAIALDYASDEKRQIWSQRIDRIGVTGGTNMSSGLDLALSTLTAQRSPFRAVRVLLISDGQVNEGDVSMAGLSQRVRKGLSMDANVSAVGVGFDFNEQLMTQLANVGAGNFYFLDNSLELASVFRQELDSARETIAQALEVALRPAPGVQLVDAAGYPLEWHDGTAVLRPGNLFSGQERRLWLTFEVPHEVPGTSSLADVGLAFRTVVGGTSEERHELALPELPQIACVDSQEQFYDAIDHDMWSRSVAEEEYGALQQTVANYVREGRKDAAKQEIAAYRQHNSVMNEVVQSSDVEMRLQETEALEADVDDAFEGRDQLHKQNSLSKQQISYGWDNRRAGAKKVPSSPATQDTATNSNSPDDH